MKVIEIQPKQEDEIPIRLAQIELLLEEIRDGMAPSLAVRCGRAAVTAFGSVIGVAVLLTIAIALLRPFTNLEIFGDRIERVLDRLDQPQRK